MAEENKESVKQLLLEKSGNNKKWTAGLMGNIDVETGGTFDYREKEKSPKKGEGGYGLFQITGAHQKAYWDYLKNTKKTDSAASQIDFVHDNIERNERSTQDIGSGHAKKLREIRDNPDATAEEIAAEFSDRYERPGVPHKDRRRESAKETFDVLNKPTLPNALEEGKDDGGAMLTIDPWNLFSPT